MAVPTEAELRREAHIGCLAMIIALPPQWLEGVDTEAMLVELHDHARRVLESRIVFSMETGRSVR